MCTSLVLGSSSLPLCAASLEVKVALLPLQLPQRSPGGLALGIPVVENQALRWPWLTNVYVTRKAVSWNRVMPQYEVGRSLLFQIELVC